jgi:uncharacterized protein YdcH (DUF465 family)
MTREKLIHHLESLREKHEKLDKQIDLMESNGNYVDDDLNHLKKKRLSIKDEMEQTNRKLDKLM